MPAYCLSLFKDIEIRNILDFKGLDKCPALRCPMAEDALL